MVIRTGLLHVPALDTALSGALREQLSHLEAGCVVVLEGAVGSQRNWVAETLRSWCDEEELDLVLTLGGTWPAPGPSSAECVPEATLDILDRLAPGLAETMRAEVAAEHPLALLDRGVAGIRSRTLVVNLPEGAGAGLFLAAIADLLPAYVAHLQGDLHAPRLGAASVDAESAIHGDDAAPPSAMTGLDATEFAAFLARRSAGDASASA